MRMAPKAAEKRVSVIGGRLRDVLDDLDRAACPNCGQKTLTIEHIRRSGIRITCEGYYEHGEEGSCPFVQYHVGTTTDELPAVDKAPAEAS